ncbi:MAG: type II toxin-antitoxin system RelE/ParE family toxin [Candidatus Omnitrophota bacterium]|jgi:plasmid stabilization system protein ParE|nr:MAG: type II toxin-antitoxin system RelE/ParE family toxin [Candidatus Omnitrophota bacterium]
MANITLLPAARHDLDALWDSPIAKRNPSTADRLIRTIDQKLRLLVERPKLGTVRFRLAPGIRIFPIGNYNIFTDLSMPVLKSFHVLHSKSPKSQPLAPNP